MLLAEEAAAGEPKWEEQTESMGLNQQEPVPTQELSGRVQS